MQKTVQLVFKTLCFFFELWVELCVKLNASFRSVEGPNSDQQKIFSNSNCGLFKTTYSYKVHPFNLTHSLAMFPWLKILFIWPLFNHTLDPCNSATTTQCIPFASFIRLFRVDKQCQQLYTTSLKCAEAVLLT